MSTAIAQRVHAHDDGIEAVKAELRQRFDAQLARAPDAVLQQLVRMKDDKAFPALAKAAVDEKRSDEVRRQAAIARMRVKAFERVKERCELLEAPEVTAILGITRQALSQKAKAGKVVAYTNHRRKYYPAFQFADNKIRSVIGKLIRELKIDLADAADVNFFIQHLIDRIDYSDAGEPRNVLPRFELLDDDAALEIIKRDYVNRYEMGQ